MTVETEHVQAPVESAAPAPAWDLLITLTAAPFGSDTVTTVLRMLTAASNRDVRVQVWACGYATTLTQSGLGSGKPLDLRDIRAQHPSTAELISRLLAAADGRLRWYVCRFCAEDRGASHHIDGVVLRSFSRFAGHVADSATTVYIGGA